MNNFDTEMTKIEENKLEKRENLLASAYSLFMRKGIHNTSISDITDNAGVAKGTFYLYFIDKWDIYEKLIIERSYLLFDEAMIYSNNKRSKSFKEKILDIADYIINAFIENKELLKFIGRNLSLGIYNDSLVDEYQEQYKNVRDILEKELKSYNSKIKNAKATLFMIIELISSTCYDSILNDIPLSIDKYKPILFNEIKKMIDK